MTYKSYEARIQRIAEVTKGLRRCAKLIAALLLTAVLATVGYLVAKGMVIGGVTCAPVLAYGDDATPSSFVVMGSAVYEYAAEESDEWSRVPPVLPGKYRVRAVTERSFGRVSYSAPTPFTIEPRKVTVTVSEDSVPYGAMPTVSVELREGDQVDAVSLEFENLAISPNTPVHISKKTIRIVNADGVDVTSAYELTTLDKVVAVVPRPITVSTGSAEKEYDGAPLTAEKWSIVEGALVEGDTVETRFPSAVNVTGEAAVNQPVELVIRNADGEDVTHFYNVTGQWGSLTVKPRPVSVRTQPLNWTYLSPKVPDAGTAELDESTPLPDGYRYEVAAPTLPTVPGQYFHVRKLTIYNADGEDVTANFVINEGREDHENWGAITIAPCPLVVTTPDGVKDMYDGNALTATPATPDEITQMLLASDMIPDFQALGHRVVVDEDTVTRVTNATPREGVENRFAIRILDAYDVDVTDTHYAITYDYGSLVVYPVELMVTTPGDVKLPYNARPQSWTENVITDDLRHNLPYGHTVEIASATEVTDVEQGILENAVTILVRNGRGEDVTASFDITYDYGTIAVTPLEISIVPERLSRVYDGTALTVGSALVVTGSTNGIPNEGYRIEITDMDRTSPLIHVGSKTVSDYEYVILDGEGQDITDNFAVNCLDGVWEVTPRPITVTPEPREKEYDGAPLTAETVTVTGLPQGIDFTVVPRFEGEQTVVGSGDSAVTSLVIYNAAGEDVTHCFDLTKKIGKLTVTPRKLAVTTASPAQYTYNGKPQGESPEVMLETILASLNHALPLGWTFELSEPVTITNVAESGTENRVTVRVLDAVGADVTEYCDITYNYGTLTMDRLAITVVPGDDTKVYDGRPLYGYRKYTVVGILSKLGHKLILPEDKTGFAEITEVGSVANTFPQNGYKVTVGGVDVTENYQITVDTTAEKRLMVTSRVITLTIDRLDMVYDGESHAPDVDVTSKLKLVEFSGTDRDGSYIIRHELVCKNAKLGKDVTATPLTYQAEDYLVVSRKYRTRGGGMIFESEEDVTANYTLEQGQSGSLTITHRLLTLTTADGRKEFDGVELAVPTIVAGSENLVPGHSLGLFDFASITKAGVIPNTCRAQITADGEDVTHNYQVTIIPGTLEITKRRLTVTTGDLSWEFDGLTHSSTGQDVSITNMPMTLSAQLGNFSTIYRVGETANTCTLTILTADGEDVTDQCTVEYHWGTLQIVPCELTVLTESESKPYDGLPLVHTADRVWVEGLPSSLTFRADKFSSITRVGQVINALEVTILDGNGEDVTDQCVIDTMFGVLSISPREIRVSTAAKRKPYDGLPLYGAMEDVTVENLPGLPAQHTFVAEDFNSVTEFGEIENSCTITILNQNGEDVTDQFIIETVFGILQIEQREISVTTPSASKEYDGTPLVTDESMIRVEGLLDGHRIDGESLAENIFVHTTEENRWSIKILDQNGNDKTSQYKITQENWGTLTIVKRKITVITPDLSKEFDGKPLMATAEQILLENAAPNHTHSPVVAQLIQVGSIPHECTVTIFHPNGTDVTDQHEITYVFGTLTVQQRKIHVGSPSSEKEYDGTPLTSTAEELEIEGLPAGFRLEIRGATEMSLTDVGTVENRYDVRILDSEGNDVTSLCEITYEFGHLTVLPRRLTVETPNASKAYDGTPLVAAPNLVTVSGLVSGHTFMAVTNASIIYPGSVANTLDGWTVTCDGVDVSHNYVTEAIVAGALTVLPPAEVNPPDEPPVVPDPPLDPEEPEEPDERIHLEIKPYEVSVLYDGMPHGPTSYWISAGQLPSGYTITSVEYTVPQVNVGTYTSYVRSLRILNERGEDVTDTHFVLQFATAKLCILPRPLTVTTPDLSKTYDTTPLYSDPLAVQVMGLAAGQQVVIDNDVSITQIGSVENICTVIVLDQNGNDVTDMYSIRYRYGFLTVEGLHLRVETLNMGKEYDGTPLVSDPSTVKLTGLADGHRVNLENVVSITDIGTVLNECTVTVWDENGNNVTEWYEITYEYGYLSVSPRGVLVYTESNSKRYDRLPLSTSPDSVQVSGLLDGHRYEIYGMASITEVGSVENACEIRITDADGNDVMDLYTPFYQFGTLTVLYPRVTVVTPDDQKPYDGIPLTGNVDSIYVAGVLDGHRCVLNHHATITEIGRIENACSIRVLDENGHDVTGMYELAPQFGILEVTKRQLVVETPHISKQFDGMPLVSNPDAVVVEGLLDGHTYALDNNVSITDIGEVENLCSITILDENGGVVDHLYDVEYRYGTLMVTRRGLDVQTPSAEKVYDGFPLMSDPDEIQVSGLLEGHSYFVADLVSITNISSVSNSCTVTVRDGEGNDVTHLYSIQNYFGTLTVYGIEPIDLVIRPYEVTVTYDGLPHGPSSFWITNNQKLPEGYTFTNVVFTEPYVDAGYHESRVLSLTILNERGEDVTNSEFRITYENAKVQIYHRELTIETGSLSVKFDGGVHKNPTYQIVGGGLLSGHKFEVEVTGEVRDYTPEQVVYNVVGRFEIRNADGRVVLEGNSGDPSSFLLQRDEHGNVLYAFEEFIGGNYRFVIRYGTLNLTWR